MKLRVALLPSLVALSLGCASPDVVPRAELAWPPQAPQVVLERVLGTPRDLGRRSIWRRIVGAPEDPLFVRPYGAAWEGDELVVTDPGAGRVVRLGLGKRAVRSSAGDLSTPMGVAFCGPGLVVADSTAGRVVLLDSELEVSRVLLEGLDRPTAVVCLEDRVLVTETGRHRILSLSLSPGTVEPGETAVPFAFGRRGRAPGEFNYPVALAYRGRSLWVGDTLNFRVQELDGLSGEPLRRFGRLGDSPGEMPRIKGMTIDALGRLWVSDAYLDQVALYSLDGTFLMSIGAFGSEPGMFSFPAGLASHSNGRVAVVDSLNRRVQIFRVVEAEGSKGSG